MDNSGENYYDNEELMERAIFYAGTHVVHVDCPYTQNDCEHMVRDAYYEGFKAFYEGIIKPMFDTCEGETNPLLIGYRTALADAINLSGFANIKTEDLMP